MSDIYNEGNPRDLFELTECIGSGAYGSVFRARDKKTGEIWAVKKLQFDDPAEVQEIEKEIIMLKRFHHHSIVGYRGSWRESETCIWIAMEMCEEGSVLSALEAVKHGVSEEQLSFILRETLQGLEYLHKDHSIHRDLKAGNLLLTSKGDIKIADFGVSASVARTIDKRNTVIGSPYWMAPEVLQEQGYDFHADIWSLGITAIEMIDTRPPLAEVHAFRAVFQIPKNPPPTLRHKDQHSPELNNFLECCLQKDPKQRKPCSELLQHEFIKKYASSTHDCMQSLLHEVALAKERKKELNRKLEAAQEAEEQKPKHAAKAAAPAAQDEDDDDEEGYGTMIPSKPKQPAASEEEESEWEEEGEEEYGTMRIVPKSQQKPAAAPAAAAAEEEESEYEDDEEEEEGGTMIVTNPSDWKAKIAAAGKASQAGK